MTTQNDSSFMPEKDLLYTIVADLKRTSREYLTAATESNCSSVRQMFTDLTNDTLRLQGEVFTLMQQQTQYSLPSQAPRSELDKHVQASKKTQQESRQFVSEKTGDDIQNGYIPKTEQQQSQSGSTQYM
ncbi:spore coat protein [Paenibacillus macquariensis]|uniref:Coat F domain-containing protein n=1 Tax=Paenibacillus macquariensis TaxID=948756 RepID=A0ABY1JSI5_9BACL|nr:spore coat protein [Paenibacillus macquariensis]MEC0092938.1 spore coat protein [Paenibacillus macquariensis]OAB36303.1 coat protein F [Paenibacillus macquariensis subsp. macquariensis]SIQ69144.1 Coat F domain-containing protein [Paenibacillus macquariensis]